MVESAPTQPRIPSVYLVEDHELFALGVQRMIEDSPHFSFAGHADSVLTAVAEIQRVQPDVVLVDLQLKGENGLSIVRSLRAHGDLPLIAVITNHNDPRLVATCEQAGANAFILKEEPLDRVLDKLRQMRAGHWAPPDNGMPQGGPKTNALHPEIAAWSSLSPREIDCMKWLARDLQQVEVADKLNISLNTLKNHRKNIYKKMGFKTKTDLVIFCRENQLI